MAWVWPTTIFILPGLTKRDGDPVCTVKVVGLLATPFTVTRTGPVVAPAGTFATMLVAFQLVRGAVVPLKVTVPWDVPKFVPAIVTEVPTGPDAGLRLVTVGEVDVTVKLAILLVTLETVTSTFPVVAPGGTDTWMLVGPQIVAGAAATPLNLTVLKPCVAAKFVPVIVTGVPTGPFVGLRLVMLGVRTTVNGTPFVFSPLPLT